MSDAAIRAARAEEAESVLRVLCAAFSLSAEAARPFFQQDPFYDLSHKRVLCLPEDGIVSCLTVVPTELRVGPGGALVPVGGIAGVATRPDQQRRGYAGALLSETVRAVPGELGYPVLALLAAEAALYRSLGWATVSRQARWRGAASALVTADSANGDAGVSISAVQTASEWDAVHRLHDAATRERTGACRRDARRWRVIADFTPGREAVLCMDTTGQAVGYGIYEPLPENVLRVLELWGRTPAARAALRARVARAAEGSVEWPASPEDARAFGLRLPPPTEPGLLLRLADLPAALQCVHAALYAPVLAAQGETLTLRARDPVQPLNERPVRLSAAGVSVGGHGAGHWLAADIGALAQCYSGYSLPSELASAGLFTASSPAALALADGLFPARAPFFAPLDQF